MTIENLDERLGFLGKGSLLIAWGGSGVSAMGRHFMRATEAVPMLIDATFAMGFTGVMTVGVIAIYKAVKNELKL